MRNYITLNGKNSNEINGLLIQELPPISKPQIRTEVEEIDGRDGDIVTKLGFAAYDKEFTVGLYKDFDINAIIAYFNSEGTVVFSNEPDKYYNYQIIDQIDFERLVRYRTATVRMHCQPFKYSNTEGARTLGNKGTASGEGSFITLDNTPEAQFSKIDPKGNTEQTTYSGKNLFDNSTLYHGYFFDNPSTLAADEKYRTAIIDNLPAGTYTFSCDLTNCYMLRWYGDGTTTTIGVTENSHTITTTTTGKVAFCIRNNNTTTITQDVKCQLELGSTATAYEPYVGGTPAPNPSFPQPISVVTGENVVKVEGKNLFDGNYVAYAIGGSNGNQWFVANSSRSAIIPCQPSTTYTIKKYGGNRFSIADAPTIPANNTIVNVIYNNASASQYTFTTSATARYLLVYVSNDSTEPEMQVELGSTATTYEPYQSQSYEVNLGKNLAPNNATSQTMNQVVFTKNDDGSITANGTADSTAFYPVTDNFWLEAGTYTLSSTNQCTTTAYLQLIEVATGSPVLTNLNNTKSSSFTITNGKTARLYYRIASGAQVNLTVFPQLERGTLATTYAPYFTPIELAKIGNYQDRIYKDDSKWYIEKKVGKVVLDGTETWTDRGYGGHTYGISVNATNPFTLASRSTSEIITLSDYFNSIRFDERTNNIPNSMYINQDVFRLEVRNTQWATVSDFTTWLSTHNTIVYYALATPTTTEITNEALIAQLDALEQAHAYKGRTHIAAIAQGSNAPHIIEAEVQRSSDGNITNNGNIVSKPTLTIYGSGNIGVSLNGYQILEITLGDEEYITIDTAAMEAYKDTLDNLKNRLVNGDYSKFALRPGSNMIEFSGTVSKCVISKYSRWL